LASGSFLASEAMLFGGLFSAYIFLQLDVMDFHADGKRPTAQAVTFS
jgi:hypothetical protein